ncbi:MAG: hypothetical protein RIC84_22825 [Aggregatilineales bacterium]
MSDKPSPAQMVKRVIAVAQLLTNVTQDKQPAPHPSADSVAKNTKRKS